MPGFVTIFLIPLFVTLFGAVVYDAIRRRKKDYHISLEAESLRSYREKESGNIKISLSYKNERIGDRIVVLSFRLTNDGRKDVKFDTTFQEKIKLSFPGVRILDVVIDKQSDDVGATVMCENNIWSLSWKLLKSKEYIDIRLICVNPKDEDIVTAERMAQKIDFKFRADNIDEIDTVVSRQSKIARRLLFGLVLLFLGMAAFLPIIVAPQFSASIDGRPAGVVSFKYNIYTKSYSAVSDQGEVVAKGLAPTNVTDLALVGYHGIPRDIIVLWCVIAFYIVNFLVAYFFRNTPFMQDVLSLSKLLKKKKE